MVDGIQEFIESIKEPTSDNTTTYTAVVSRVDREGVIWVNVEGSDKETPTASTSTEVKSGDVVSVQWRNNRLYIGGNDSNPSAGIARVSKNESATEQAWEQALSAQLAADKAWEEADRALIAADSAENSARVANRAANDALTQLSVVEEVVQTLEWISEHGTYKLATDTEVVDGQLYFTLTGTAVSPDSLQDGTKLSNLESYYELSNGVYVKTTDTTYNASKTYYKVSAELVSEPTGNPHDQGYYVIDSIDESVENYIASHLALTDSGLWVVKDNQGYKILLAHDGLKVYDSQGHLVSTFGENIIFDSSRPQSIGGEEAYIVFHDTDNDLVPDTITIGGNVIMSGSSNPLSQVIESLQSNASGTLIYDHEYVLNNAKTVATFTAHVYRGGRDVTSEFSDEQFTWYYKTEGSEDPLPINTNTENNPQNSGKTISVSISLMGYGGEVIGRFTTTSDRGLLRSNGDALTDANNQTLTARSEGSGETVRVRDLEYTTTLYPADGVLVVQSETERLTTISTLSDMVDKHFEYTQNVPSATWTVQHNLRKHPSITVIDSAGTEVVGDYQYIDDNNAVLTFIGAFSGKAYFN